FTSRSLCYRKYMSRSKHKRRIDSRAFLAIILVAALVFSATARASAHSQRAKKEKDRPAAPLLCQVNNVTVEMPKEFLPLRVVNNSYIARENSVGVLTLNNGFPQPIQEIAIVLEYLDAQGKQIFATPFAATANPLVSPMWFSDNLPSQYSIVQWKTPVATGATFSIGATSGLTSSVCPAQARATLLHIAFQNGKILDWSASDWELPVQPEEIPGNLQIDTPHPASLPQAFLVRVHIPASNGSPIPSVQIRLLTGKPSPFFDEIRDRMRNWRYWFELRGGKSVDGDVLLLIRVHSTGEPSGGNIFRITPAEVSRTLGIVDLVPQAASGQWAVFYGGANLVTPAAQTR
ncbi:MAG: hypothetical protein ACRD4H_10180, partial [Candidatus Acidiferrales bacterium]